MPSVVESSIKIRSPIPSRVQEHYATYIIMHMHADRLYIIVATEHRIALSPTTRERARTLCSTVLVAVDRTASSFQPCSFWSVLQGKQGPLPPDNLNGPGERNGRCRSGNVLRARNSRLLRLVLCVLRGLLRHSGRVQLYATGCCSVYQTTP